MGLVAGSLRLSYRLVLMMALVAAATTTIAVINSETGIVDAQGLNRITAEEHATTLTLKINSNQPWLRPGFRNATVHRHGYILLLAFLNGQTSG